MSKTTDEGLRQGDEWAGVSRPGNVPSFAQVSKANAYAAGLAQGRFLNEEERLEALAIMEAES